MRSLMMSLFCFQLDVTGFCCWEEKCKSRGEPLHTLDEFWIRRFFFFPYSWIEFLCSRAAAYHQRKCSGAEKKTLQPVLWSVVILWAIGPLVLHTHTNSKWNPALLVLLFLNYIYQRTLRIYSFKSGRGVESSRETVYGAAYCRMKTAATVTSGIYNAKSLWSAV